MPGALETGTCMSTDISERPLSRSATVRIVTRRAGDTRSAIGFGETIDGGKGGSGLIKPRRGILQAQIAT